MILINVQWPHCCPPQTTPTQLKPYRHIPNNTHWVRGLKTVVCCFFRLAVIINQTLLQTFSSLNCWQLLNCMKETDSHSQSKLSHFFQTQQLLSNQNREEVWELLLSTLWRVCRPWPLTSNLLVRIFRTFGTQISASENASHASMLMVQRVGLSNFHEHTHNVVTNAVYSNNVTYPTTNSAPSNTMQTHTRTHNHKTLSMSLSVLHNDWLKEQDARVCVCGRSNLFSHYCLCKTDTHTLRIFWLLC